MFLKSSRGSLNHISYSFSIHFGISTPSDGSGRGPSYVKLALCHGTPPTGIASIVLYRSQWPIKGGSAANSSNEAAHRVHRISILPADILTRLNRNSAVSNERRLLKGVQSVVSFIPAIGASDPTFNGFPLLLQGTPTIKNSKVVK